MNIIISDPDSEVESIYGYPQYYKSPSGSMFIKIVDQYKYTSISYSYGELHKESCAGANDRIQKRIDNRDLVQSTAEEFAEMDAR